MEIASKYDPREVETKWYQYWLDNKLFASKPDGRAPYTVVIPPPNVTGVLHMGHMLNNTIQDILVRRARMEGKNACWVPGTDHASIATEAKVVAKLAEKGVKKTDLSRDEFLKHAWDWTHEHGGIILKQLRRLGASCDWDRTAFTMDDERSESVLKVFCDLYEKGLIYRGVRMVNWDPQAQTALSDEEVVYKEEHSKLFYLKYMVVEEPGKYAVVATTRPETIMGDTAMCINPNDPKNTWLKGKHIIVPLVGREIPVIEDDYVDIEFGTGCLKVTPAHDINDHNLGLKHGLDTIDIFNDNGTLSEAAGLYVGMDRMDVRKQIAGDLEVAGLMEKTEDYNNKVGYSERTHVPIEPKLSTQWFLKMQHFADLALQPVMDDDIAFYPQKYKNTYRHWLENIKDWCISRQLWWGHRIPAYYFTANGKRECVVALTAEEALAKAKAVCGTLTAADLEQDEDCLDTWFSSWLWPISVFNGINQPDNEEINYYYPTSDLVTGPDIIFFWVARMIMAGYEYRGKMPFKNVYFTGIVRDKQGRKMSKSLGNGIDPVEVIEKYGADTLRFMLITGNTPGNDMRFYWERVEAARNFANKIWNASRYMLMNLEGSDASFVPTAKDYTLADRWILSRAEETTRDVTANLEHYELGEAGRTIYEFLWSEFCDWYIELTKARLYDKENVRAKNTALYVLRTVLERTMRLLHPFMPFLTEEIWQKLPHEGESIMRAPWPEVSEAEIDAEAEASMTAIMEVIKTTRNLRAELGTPPSKKSALILRVRDAALADVFAAHEDYFFALASASEVSFLAADAPDPENVVTGALAGAAVYLPLAGLIDVEKETARLTKERANLEKEIARLTGKLSNEGFTSKAPAAVVAAEREKLAGYEEKIALIRTRLTDIEKL